VVATLREMQEHWDGSGPHGSRAEDIRDGARRRGGERLRRDGEPRAYRAGSDLDAALTELSPRSVRSSIAGSSPR